jgi:enoyl-[acyl-carrier protein] reductase/trans-2-enoyl-CoA reductase (NAD+)
MPIKVKDMRIDPIIDGVISRSAHPYGCEKSIIHQIQYARSARQITQGPKRVLILGASSGLGLAARIALTFGGAESDTIGVSLDPPPQLDTPQQKGRTGSAGFYNNLFFNKYATQAGRVAVDIQGDVFSESTKADVIEAIETYFEGEVDLIIYSIASSKRRKPNSDTFWHSTIKPIGQAVESTLIDIGQDHWQNIRLEPANEKEIESTLKVMGGEDWEQWVDALINADSIAEGCKSIAFSYVGPPLTYPIYLDGTLGRAKVDLHQTSHSLNLKLSNYNGGAFAVVCKSLITRASMFIPGFFPYLMALNYAMTTRGVNENCNEQMQRLFTDKLYHTSTTPVDGERLIRLDEGELSHQTQENTRMLLNDINADNFSQLKAYQALKQEFLQINGFGWQGIDYTKPVSIDKFLSS